MKKGILYFKVITGKIKAKLGIRSKRKNFGNRTYFSPSDTSQLIGEMLRKGTSFSAGRLGMVELNLLIEAEQADTGGPVLFPRKCCGSEWYLVPTNLNSFINTTRQAYKEIDILANWYASSLREEILIQKYTKADLVSTHYSITNPFLQDKPWTKYLAAKKVLVISPFTDEISQQYKIREKLFENPDILPEFELKTYKAIWIQDYMEQNQCSYQDIIDKYLKDISKIDFDVALISCSFPSFALAAGIKRIGKIGIQMGGDLQILFGIKGKRWDSIPAIASLYNEFWIRPNAAHSPTDADKMDQRCYW